MAARLPCPLTPSMVVIPCPWQLAANSVQASMGLPPTCTVQAPQDESSQPRLVPVSRKSSRNASSSSLLGSTASSWLRPLTRSSISSLFIYEPSELSFEPALALPSPERPYQYPKSVAAA